MLTNIIKNIIKDIPSVANSEIKLIFSNLETGELCFSPKDRNLAILVKRPKESVSSAEDFKKRSIFDLIYFAANGDIEFDMNKPHTMQTLANDIDDIINQDVVVWNLND